MALILWVYLASLSQNMLQSGRLFQTISDIECQCCRTVQDAEVSANTAVRVLTGSNQTVLLFHALFNGIINRSDSGWIIFKVHVRTDID